MYSALFSMGGPSLQSRMTEKKFSVNELFLKEESEPPIMSLIRRSVFITGSIILAVLLILAVPAAAMRMVPDSGACSTSLFSPSAGQHTLSQESSDCQKDCNYFCSLACDDGWCMIACMRNCDRYCSGEKS
jgi:hypothetical protein